MSLFSFFFFARAHGSFRYQNVDIRVFHGEHRPREIRTRRHFGKQANLYQKEDKEDGQTE